MRAKQFSKDEDDRNHWADLAEGCYDQILKNYPHSRWVSGATSQLTSMGMTAPPPDPAAAQRMQEAQLYAKSHHSLRVSLLNFPMAMVKSNPDVSLAARSGMPTITAPDDVVSATEVLKKGAPGPNFTLASSLPPADAGAGDAGTDSTTAVEAVPSTGTGASSSGSSVGAEIIAAPASDAAAASMVAADPSAAPASTPPASTTPDAPAAVADAPSSSAAPSGVSGSSGDAASQASQTAGGQNQAAPVPQTASKNDSSTESTSKKKKGLKKIIPF
jgi:hypothetical protein